MKFNPSICIDCLPTAVCGRVSTKLAAGLAVHENKGSVVSIQYDTLWAGLAVHENKGSVVSIQYDALWTRLKSTSRHTITMQCDCNLSRNYLLILSWIANLFTLPNLMPLTFSSYSHVHFLIEDNRKHKFTFKAARSISLLYLRHFIERNYSGLPQSRSHHVDMR